MKFIAAFLVLGCVMLNAAEIVIYKPTLQLIGKRNVPRRQSVPGSGVVRVEQVPELGYRFIFAIQNTSGSIIKLATGFNHIRFNAEPGKNQFVLGLSHRIMSVKVENGKAFLLNFNNYKVIVTLNGVVYTIDAYGYLIVSDAK